MNKVFKGLGLASVVMLITGGSLYATYTPPSKAAVGDASTLGGKTVDKLVVGTANALADTARIKLVNLPVTSVTSNYESAVTFNKTTKIQGSLLQRVQAISTGGIDEAGAVQIDAQVVFVTGSTKYVKLPDPSGINNGSVIWVKNLHTDATTDGDVILTPFAPDKGVNTAAYPIGYDTGSDTIVAKASLTLISDGNEWHPL